MWCKLTLPVTEATVGGVNCFLWVRVNVSCFTGSGFWPSTTTKEACCPLTASVLWVLPGSAVLVDDLVCWNLSLWKSPWQLVLVAVAVENVEVALEHLVTVYC